MTNYVRDPAPEAGPGWSVSDETPIPRHASTDSLLYGFAFDEDFPPRLNCPGDCGKFCEPASVGEAADWALGHKCADDDEPLTDVPMVCTTCRKPVREVRPGDWSHVSMDDGRECGTYPVKAMVAAGNENVPLAGTPLELRDSEPTTGEGQQ